MKILVTAGPTREAIDPVRFISNRSSGKMGYAIARAAIKRGHAVRLISGPVALPAPGKARLVSITTAKEMLAAVSSNLDWCDVLIMTAAVCDWRPAMISRCKLKKSSALPFIKLERTSDILKSIAGRKGARTFVGFAAETGDPSREAKRKLKEKNLDLIVANDVSRPDAGFDVDTNRVILITADSKARKLPLMSKEDVAGRILDWIEDGKG